VKEMSFKSGVKGRWSEGWWERRWWLWWADMHRMRWSWWTRRRVNTVYTTTMLCSCGARAAEFAKSR